MSDTAEVKPKRKKGVQYFTQETEDAIVRYNNATDHLEKEKIYHQSIHYPFFKLTENIIHTFKFYHTEVDNLEDLQHEIIVFLIARLHLFDPSRGAKAYSYFGTIAKRYLIFNNTKNYQKKIEKSSISVLEDNDTHSYSIDNVNNNDSYHSKLSLFMNRYVDYCTDNIFDLFVKDEEAQIADAILELFRKREDIDVFNKKALYIYIREQVDAKTPKITKVAGKLYDIFKRSYIKYLETDIIDFTR
jgi:hypothetical protein